MLLGEILQKGEEFIGREGLKLPLSILGAESLQGVGVAVYRSLSYIRSLMTLEQIHCFLYGHCILLVVLCGLWGYRDTYHTNEVQGELERRMTGVAIGEKCTYKELGYAL